MRAHVGQGLACALLLAGTAQAGPPHVDARDYPAPGAGHARFVAAERRLERGFDNICGDTFCEGEYYNLRAMRLRCSVHQASGAVGSCVWTFAGSQTWVRQTGKIDVDHAMYACKLPLAAGTSLEQLLQLWEAGSPDDALDASLPGSTVSAYEALTDCL